MAPLQGRVLILGKQKASALIAGVSKFPFVVMKSANTWQAMHSLKCRGVPYRGSVEGSIQALSKAPPPGMHHVCR